MLSTVQPSMLPSHIPLVTIFELSHILRSPIGLFSYDIPPDLTRLQTSSLSGFKLNHIMSSLPGILPSYFPPDLTIPRPYLDPSTEPSNYTSSVNSVTPIQDHR